MNDNSQNPTRTLWRAKGKQTKTTVVIGRPLRKWILDDFTTSVVHLNIDGALGVALDNIRDTARDKNRRGSRLNLPIKSLRLMLASAFPTLISVDRDLGRGKAPGAALTLFQDDEEVDSLCAKARKTIRIWASQNLSPWCEEHGLEGLAEPVIEATKTGGVSGALHAHQGMKQEDGSPNYDLLLRVLAAELDGEELFEGMGPCNLVMSAEPGGQIELITDPFPLHERFWVSMRCNISLSTIPFTGQTYLKVSASKLTWANAAPTEKFNSGRMATGYVFQRDGQVMPIEIVQQKSRDWEFGDGYIAARYLSGNQLPATLQDALALARPRWRSAPDEDSSQWWVGLPMTTRLFSSVGPRTVFEVDEYDLEATVYELLRAYLHEEAHFSAVPKRAGRQLADARMLQPDDLNLSLGSGDESAEPQEDASAEKRDAQLQATRDQFASALRILHGVRKPKLWVFVSGQKEREIIERAVAVLFGDAVELATPNPLPTGTHGLQKALPQSQEKEQVRFDARLAAWKPACDVISANGDQPNVALICAPEFVDRQREDSVNFFAGIKALCMAGADVHHLQPPRGEKKQHYVEFVHRLQSALMDAFFAHSGLLLGVDTFMRKMLEAQVVSRNVYGLQIVTSRARPFSGEQDTSFVLQTKLPVATGITEARYLWSKAGRISRSEWMPLAAALRWLAAHSPLGDASNRWLDTDFERLTHELLDHIHEEDPRALVLLDWSNTAGKLKGLSDGALLSGGRPRIHNVDLTQAFPHMTIARIRRGKHTLALRGVQSRTFEAIEGKEPTQSEEYLTSFNNLVEMQPERGIETEARRGHFIGCMGYGKNTGIPRGLSSYRTVTRFSKIKTDDEKLVVTEPVYVRETSSPCDKDCSVPSPIDITILTCPGDVQPSTMAQVVMGMRVGYVHYSAWTAKPAPLFFIGKVTDHIIRYDREDALVEPEPEDSAGVEQEPSTLVEEVLKDMRDPVSDPAPSMPEVQTAYTAVGVAEHAVIREPPPATVSSGTVPVAAEQDQSDALFGLEVDDAYSSPSLLRELASGRIRVNVELPYFVTLGSVFGSCPEPSRANIHRAWWRMKRGALARENEPDPARGQVFERVFRKLRIPQCMQALAYAQEPLSGTPLIPPLAAILAKIRAETGRDTAALTTTRERADMLVEHAISTGADEELAWALFCVAQLAHRKDRKLLSDAARARGGPMTGAAVDYVRRSDQAIKDIIQARAEKTHLPPRTFNYPCQKAFAPKPSNADAQRPESVPAGVGETEEDDALIDNPTLASAVKAVRSLTPGADDFASVRDQIESLLNDLESQHASILSQRETEAALKSNHLREIDSLRQKVSSFLRRYEELAAKGSSELRKLETAIPADVAASEVSALMARATCIDDLLTQLLQALEVAASAEAAAMQFGLPPARKKELHAKVHAAYEAVTSVEAQLAEAIEQQPKVVSVLEPSQGQSGGDAEASTSATEATQPTAPAFGESAATAAVAAPDQTPETVAPLRPAPVSVSPPGGQAAVLAPKSDEPQADQKLKAPATTVLATGSVSQATDAADNDQDDFVQSTDISPQEEISVALSAESRERAFGALHTLTQKRRYGLASVMATVLFDALKSEGYAEHSVLVNSACDALDAVDCRVVTDSRVNEDLIELLALQEAFDGRHSHCRPEFIALGVLASTTANLMFDSKAGDYHAQVVQFIRTRLQDHPAVCAFLNELDQVRYRGTLTKEQCLSVHGDAIEAYKAAMESYAARAKDWLHDPEIITTKHLGFMRILRAMLEPDQPLGKAIELIRARDGKALRQIDGLRKIGDKPSAAISECARRINERSPPDGKVAKWLVQNVENTTSFIAGVQKAIEDADSSASDRGRRDEKNAYLERLYSAMKGAIKDIQDGMSAAPGLERVYQTASVGMLKAVSRMFGDGKHKTCISMLDQRLLIQAPMNERFMPEIDMGSCDANDLDDRTALVTHDTVIDQLCDLAEKDLGDADGVDGATVTSVMIEAMARHMEENRFFPANCIAVVHGNAKEVARAHRDQAKALSRKVRELKYLVQHANLLSAIDPAASRRMDTVLANVERSINENSLEKCVGWKEPGIGAFVDFPQAYHSLAVNVEVKLNNILQTRKDQTIRALDHFLEDHEDLAREVGQIKGFLSNRHLASGLRAAEDAFKTLKAEKRLPATTNESTGVAGAYNEFFQSAKKFGSGGHRLPLDELRFKISRPREESDPSWLAPLSEEERVSACKFIDAWLEMFKTASGTQGKRAANEFFAALGCPVGPERTPTASSAEEVFMWSDSPFKDLPDVFVPPELGSQAQLIEAVILRSQRLEVELKRVVGQGHSTPRIVMTRAPLSPSQRADITFNQRVLLVDDMLVAYIAVHPKSRLKALLEVALLTYRAQPYRDYENAAVPREMFFGRERELETLNNVSGAAILYGGRRLGKTSLFGHIQYEHSRTRHVGLHALMVSMHDVAPDENAPLNAWKQIFERLHSARLVGDIKGDPARYEDFVGHIRSELVKEGSNVRSLYLLIDEADDLMKRELALTDSSKPSFVRSISAVIDNLKGHVKLRYCIAGLHNLARMTDEPNSPLGKAESIALEPYNSEKDLQRGFDLITKPLSALGFEFQDVALPWQIMSVCNFYPAFIQMYCARLLNGLYNRRQTELAPYTIKAEDLENTERDQQLLSLLRRKFKLNLDLDKRYMAIALLLADRYYTVGASNPHKYGLNTTEIRELCQLVFKRHFRQTGAGAYEALLNEMIKLNILDSADGRYILRTPHIAMMIGDRDEVQARMDELEQIPEDEARNPGERRVKAERNVPSHAEGITFPMPQGWIRNVMDGLRRTSGRAMPVIINHKLSGFDGFFEHGATWSLLGGDLQLEFKRTSGPGDFETRQKAKAATHKQQVKSLLILQPRQIRIDAISAYAEMAQRLQRKNTQVALLLPMQESIE